MLYSGSLPFPRLRLRSVVRSIWLGGTVAGMAVLSLPDALAEESVFELGSVVVRGDRMSTTSEEVMGEEAMRAFNRDTVSSAVNTLPGVNLSRNSRNEDIVYVRGFDARQVPLFLDGIPQYVPYDGYVDFGRFTTFDLAEIRVAKGAASLLYGPNIMGGAINLVTRKPSRELEGNVRIGAATGSERKVAANLGSNQGLWYFQLGASYLDADSFALGRSFTDHKPKPTDTDDRRENAYRTDKKGSLKIGFTPNDTDEYALAYSKQEGEKGNPVYTGRGKGARYWQWPYWDKESLYFLSSTDLNDELTLKFRLYADKYTNGLDMFKDASYTTLDGPRSIYDDKTYGSAVELVSRHFDGHELHLALHYKDDRHVDKAEGSPDKKYRDVTRSAAVEDIIELASDWRLRLGVDHEEREARQVYYWPTGTTQATNALAELAHDLRPGLEAYASVARKSRLPTIKDRYSARMGSALPNPDLKPEKARHAELGLRGEPWDGSYAEAALFYSGIDDLIQSAIVPGSSCSGGKECNQAQNISKARHRGLELSLEQALADRWKMGAAYTYLDRDNLSDRDIPLTDSPTHKLFAHLSWFPSERWELQTTLDAEEGREVSSSASASRYETLGGFAILGAKGVWKPRPDLALELGVSNLGDKDYEFSEGFPMPGRTLFANASFDF
ncbi:TonB-dependent receptor [Pseudomonas sp. Milli4]|uniref:TonB-dependent receptor n=2 Tax=Pseudomonas schmalbachii TaxID=2816993 RepID=A0ABS3TWZ6_9PSED|nr:TonB-dependent receptor [Pseudomonas schmalbachii]